MTLIPGAAGGCSTAAPDVGSVESMISTCTPSPIMLCAICWDFEVSPCAFWMSDWIPAASNPCFSSGASYRVYRVDDVVSGRMTPTLPVAVVALGGFVGGALAEALGGLVSLQIALTCPVPPPEELAPLELLPLLEPQAVTVRSAAVPIAARERVELRIVRDAFPSSDRRCAAGRMRKMSPAGT